LRNSRLRMLTPGTAEDIVSCRVAADAHPVTNPNIGGSESSRLIR
jgi:hypothetical protein